MKICFVTAFPPSGRQLNEYAFHIARELQRNPLLSLTILSDELESPQPELDGFDVVRCWRFNALSNPLRILKAIKQVNPDVVWFNLVFSSFGTPESPVAAFAGLCTPALVRLSGYYTHITLHHLMEHVDFSHAKIRLQRLFRFASSITTRILLMANSMSVLLPGYRRTLLDKYRGEHVHFRAHGIFSKPEYPAFEKRGNPDVRILAIGHWGTYKRLELLMEAFPRIAAKIPNAKLVIAGSNHHTTPGYWESMAEKYKHDSRITFRGYVPEEEIPELYASSSLLVMPYSSATGASGPAHQACEYGLPIVCADLHDFIEMAEYEGMSMDFYQTGNLDSFCEKVIRLLQSPERQREMAEQNFSAGVRMTMPEIIHRYLRTFDFHRRTKLLASMSKFRVMPRWIPSRSAIFRSASPDFINWS